nr:hypothetical protein [Tanacetum cinerariifolium]
PEEEFEEDPEEDPEAEAEDDVPPPATPPMPPIDSTYEVGGPSSVTPFPSFYLHGSEIARLDGNTELLLSNVQYLERCEKKRKVDMETVALKFVRESVPQSAGLGVRKTWTRIMPPKMMKRKAVNKMVKKQIAEAIKEYKKTRVDLGNASGSREANTSGPVTVQGCTHKTFMNGKRHPFNETEGVVGVRRWIEKVEQVFEICKCAEEDKDGGRALDIDLKGDDIEAYNNCFYKLALMCPDLVPNEKKKIERYMKGFPEKIKANITSARPTTLHEAVNLAWELVEQAVQGKAARANENNKRRWEEHQRNHPNNNNNPNNRNRNRKGVKFA